MAKIQRTNCHLVSSIQEMIVGLMPTSLMHKLSKIEWTQDHKIGQNEKIKLSRNLGIQEITNFAGICY